MRKYATFFLLLVLAVGFYWRLALLLEGLQHIPVYSDEAIDGLVIHELIKGHPVFFQFGQGYGGTFEAIITIPLQLLLGSTRLTLRLLNFLGSFLAIYIVYKIAESFFSKKIALLSALIMAVPAPYITIFAVLGVPQNYTTFLGCGIMLWMTGVLTHKDLKKHPILPWIAWGIAGGIAFWNHLITAAPVAATLFYLFVKDKKLFFRKGIWVGMFFFFVFSSPFWIYNIATSWETFKIIKPVSLGRSLELLKALSTFTLPALLGFHVPVWVDSTSFGEIPSWLFILLAITYGILLVVFIVSRFKHIIAIPFFLKKKIGAPELLLIYTLLVFFLFCRSNRGFWWALRYLYYAYISLVILISFSLNKIRQKSRIVSSILIGIIFFAHLYGDTVLYSYWRNDQFVEDMADLPETTYLHLFFQKEHIQGVYSHFWIANRLMYEADGKIVCSAAYDERFGRYPPHYLPELEKKERVAYVFYKQLGISPYQFEKAINETGGSYRKRHIGPFIVFYDFVPPSNMFEKISLEKVNIETLYNPESVHLAIDGDITTRWGSAQPQHPGMSITIDLKKTVDLNKIVFHMGMFGSDMPRGLMVTVSMDGENWEEVYEITDIYGALFWDASQPKWCMAKDYFSAVFEPVPARYITITQTGSDSRFDWSIAELEIYEERTTKEKKQ